MDIPQSIRDEILDAEHLRLLAIAYYVDGALTIAFASVFIIHFVVFAVIAANPEWMAHGGKSAPPDGLFKAFAAILGFMMVAGWTLGGLMIYAGRCIKRRARRTFTIVIGCINLPFVPVGTALGVCTLLVLTRRTVRRLYEPPEGETR